MKKKSVKTDLGLARQCLRNVAPIRPVPCSDSGGASSSQLPPGYEDSAACQFKEFKQNEDAEELW